MTNFVSFARITSICVDFHLGTLHGYIFHQNDWPNLNFPLEYQMKLVLTSHENFHVHSAYQEADLVCKMFLRTSTSLKRKPQ